MQWRKQIDQGFMSSRQSTSRIMWGVQNIVQEAVGEAIPKRKKKQTTKQNYLVWNRSPAQVGCMRQALGPGALGKPIGSGWRGRWEGGSGWGTHVNPWLFHLNVWQNPLEIKKKSKWFYKYLWKRMKIQAKKGKVPSTKCRFPKNSKVRQQGFLQNNAKKYKKRRARGQLVF